MIINDRDAKKGRFTLPINGETRKVACDEATSARGCGNPVTIGLNGTLIAVIVGIAFGILARSLSSKLYGIYQRAGQRKRFRERCLIVGAAILTHVEQDPTFATKLSEILARTVLPRTRRAVADLMGGRPRAVAIASEPPPTQLLERLGIGTFAEDAPQVPVNVADSALGKTWRKKWRRFWRHPLSRRRRKLRPGWSREA